MSGAPPAYPARRRLVLHVATMAACWILSLCHVAAAEARSYPAGRGDDATSPGYAPGGREPVPGAAWADESRLASYLRLHRVAGDPVIALYPLAAYAAATRRADPAVDASFSRLRSAAARRTGAPAAWGRPQL